MAFDTVRHRQVLVGGVHDEMWTWDGARWKWLDFAAATFSSHAMAFDQARGELVVFGGTSLPTSTWTYDGTNWTEHMAPGPSGRTETAMAYDASRQVVVLFGGRTNGFNGQLGETWEWNGSSWTQRLVSEPPPRAGHAMAFDEARSVVVLFGGFAGSAPSVMYGDTWEFNGLAWTQRSDTGPTPRRNHALAFDSTSGKVLLFGGQTNTPFVSGDTWTWDGTSWTPHATAGPSARRVHSMAQDPVYGGIMLFGGTDGTHTLGDTWHFANGAWTQIASAPKAPERRYWHAMSYDSLRDVFVLATGTTSLQIQSPVWLGSTWEWSGDQWHLRSSAGCPLRMDAGMAFDPQRGATVLFGGHQVTFNGTSYLYTYFNETHEWNGQEWTLRASSGPPPRSGSPLVLDSARNEIVLFGGVGQANGQSVYYSDLWVWNGTSWTHRPFAGTQAPAPRANHGLAYDAGRNVLVLHGGFTVFNGTAVYYKETWEFDLDSGEWNLKATSGPSSTIRHVMWYDPARNAVNLAGGLWPQNNAVWSWNGSEWSPLQIPGPAYGLTYHAGDYDALRQKLVIFGGLNTEDHTWELSGKIGDIDCDNIVGIDDLLAVIGAWGPCPPPPASCPADVEPPGGDGQVNIDDLLIVISNWG